MPRASLTPDELAHLQRARDRLDVLVREMSAVLGETRALVVTQRNTILEQRQAIEDVKQRILSHSYRVRRRYEVVFDRPSADWNDGRTTSNPD